MSVKALRVGGLARKCDKHQQYAAIVPVMRYLPNTNLIVLTDYSSRAVPARSHLCTNVAHKTLMLQSCLMDSHAHAITCFSNNLQSFWTTLSCARCLQILAYHAAVLTTTQCGTQGLLTEGRAVDHINEYLVSLGGKWDPTDE